MWQGCLLVQGNISIKTVLTKKCESSTFLNSANFQLLNYIFVFVQSILCFPAYFNKTTLSPPLQSNGFRELRNQKDRPLRSSEAHLASSAMELFGVTPFFKRYVAQSPKGRVSYRACTNQCMVFLCHLFKSYPFWGHQTWCKSLGFPFFSTCKSVWVSNIMTQGQNYPVEQWTI